MSTEDDHHVEPTEFTRINRESEPELELDPAPSSGTGSETHSPEQEVGTDRHAVLQRSRYPFNSKKLTVAHLRALAEAIGLPTLGSADQLRQCMEGKLQTERYDPRGPTRVEISYTQLEIIEIRNQGHSQKRACSTDYACA